MLFMREDVLGQVLLVKAIEETDRAGELLPLADREHATRAVLRSSADSGPASGRSETRSGPQVVRLLGERAKLLIGPLADRYPVFREILDRSSLPGWLAVLVLAGALACGIALASLDGTHRINILAFPFLGVIAWNLVVYALVAAHAVRVLFPASPSARTVSPWTGKAIGRRLSPLVDKTSQVHAKLGEVVSRYATDWAQVGGPLLAAHARRLFHLGAASLALGMIAGLYLRGIVFRYEAGWESTFLGPRVVRVVLGLVFGPASALSGIALPPTDDAVSVLRWTASGGGGDAAPWIHLIAVTLALGVIVPRLVLAALARVDAWRWRRAKSLPDSLLAYARSALGAAHAGRGSGEVVVVPYAFGVSAEARGGLQRWLESAFGRGAHMDLRAMSPYGEEARLRSMLESSTPANAEALVLLMSLAATPESENHGLAIAATRDAARQARPERELRVVIDESAYASRLAGDASLAGRLEERRNLWRTFVRGYGLEAAFVNLAATT
jgi:hypothetical protein